MGGKEEEEGMGKRGGKEEEEGKGKEGCLTCACTSCAGTPAGLSRFCTVLTMMFSTQPM
jgi:hypothetical protein